MHKYAIRVLKDEIADIKYILKKGYILSDAYVYIRENEIAELQQAIEVLKKAGEE